MIEIWQKYKMLIKYVFFGVLTTLINIAVYAFCYNMLGFINAISNIIAWILAVLFAFFTNKMYVFESRAIDIHTYFYEFVKFTGARVVTGILDLLIMLIGVDWMHGSALVFKLVSNIIVIILNYILSKFVVFKYKI